MTDTHDANQRRTLQSDFLEELDMLHDLARAVETPANEDEYNWMERLMLDMSEIRNHIYMHLTIDKEKHESLLRGK